MDPASKAKPKSPPSKSTSPGKQKTRKKHKKQRPIHPAPAATISAAEALQPIFTPVDISEASTALEKAVIEEPPKPPPAEDLVIDLSGGQPVPPEGQLALCTELILSDSKLTALPIAPSTLSVLRRLDVSSNALTALPAELPASLETLEIYSNKIKELPASIGTLSALTTLNCFNNQLRKLPPAIGTLTAVTEVNIAANKLMMLTDDHFKGWSNVTVLNLQDNNLVRLGSLEPLASLEELRIMANNLEELPKLGSHPSLTVLEAHKNRIGSIPDDYFNSTPSLARVSIYANQLTALPTSLCSACPGLVGVQAQENKLASLPDVAWPSTLETLFLQDNTTLTTLPAGLGQCAKLKRLNLGKLSLDGPSKALAEKIKKKILEQEGGIFWSTSGEMMKSAK